MNSKTKAILMIGGFLAAALLLAQLVMGQLIAGGEASRGLVKSHQHTGYLTVVVSLLYLAGSLMVIASIPTRPRS
jgi:hypothetical protein